MYILLIYNIFTVNILKKISYLKIVTSLLKVNFYQISIIIDLHYFMFPEFQASVFRNSNHPLGNSPASLYLIRWVLTDPALATAGSGMARDSPHIVAGGRVVLDLGQANQGPSSGCGVRGSLLIFFQDGRQ